MRTDEVFREENIDKIFSEFGTGEYIAEANDMYTSFGEKNDFGREWAWQFGAGRYVILVLQRHSVYENGERVYENVSFDESVGESRYRHPCYVIVLDKAQEYTIPSWKSKLSSHIIMDINDPLHFSVYMRAKEAADAARNLSLNGYKAAVMEWYADYDMF